MSTNIRRGKMFGYAVLWLGATMLCAALAYMKGSDDDQYFAGINEKVSDCRLKTDSLEKRVKSLEASNNDVTEILEKATIALANSQNACHEASEAQDHCGRLRKSMTNLENQVAAKREPVRLEGPIQIEILHSAKKPLVPKGEGVLEKLRYKPPVNLGGQKKRGAK